MPLGPGTSALTPTWLDPPRVPAQVSTVRKQFDRRAARFESHAAVVREVERRLQERLDLMKIQPRRMLDAGCGAGQGRPALLARYPQAAWVGLDLSLRMLLGGRPASAPTAWLRRLLPRHRPSAARVCADAAHMPFAEGSFDLLISNLMLHWHPSPHRLFPEFRRVLADGGLLMFSCFGPDTLRELREAFMAAWPACRPLPFVDMHDFGDMMTAAGFATPVMDVEVIRLTFPTPAALLAEAASLGGNPRDDRPAVLPGTRQARAVLAELQRRALPDGRIPLTFEIAYGHAWNDRSPRAPAGAAQSAVPLETLRGTLKRRAGG